VRIAGEPEIVCEHQQDARVRDGQRKRSAPADALPEQNH